MDDLESCVRKVLSYGLATGNADSVEELLDEVLDQYECLVQKYLELKENDCY